ncbi:MAG: nucleotidyltransferase domain-containing protein [Deltaproteobacteria bacterium]|nr:nucleotidyltransferase domain-containing protein [Deltaproteobacteria bacterium]
MEMVLSEHQKELLRREIVDCLCPEKEIKKIVIFGSFLHSGNPNDLDIAVFQDSSESYLPLALKYRKKTRPVAKKIPLDIIPLKTGAKGNSFLAEINQGEVIYER